MNPNNLLVSFQMYLVSFPSLFIFLGSKVNNIKASHSFLTAPCFKTSANLQKNKSTSKALHFISTPPCFSSQSLAVCLCPTDFHVFNQCHNDIFCKYFLCGLYPKPVLNTTPSEMKLRSSPITPPSTL